jgi:hypothetical protein
MESVTILSECRDELTIDGLLKLESSVKESPIMRLWERKTAGLTVLPDDNIVLQEGSDPLYWRLPNHRDRLAPHWKSKRLVDYPLRDHAIKCGHEYRTCLVENRPVCYLIEQDLPHLRRFYSRLLLPIDGKVVYAWRRLLPEAPVA